MDEASIGSLLYTVATGVRLVFGQELVDAYRHLSTIHLYAEVLVQLTIAQRLAAVVGQQDVFLQLYVVYLHPQSSIIKSHGA
jgi:hypothetical protein